MAAKEPKDPCRIGSSISVTGSVSGDQDLIVEGRVEGRIGLESRLLVEDGGAVEAQVEVTELEVRGSLKGDVVATKTALLRPSARVAGNIRAGEVVLEDGARFSGVIEMDVDLPDDVTVDARAR
jgi:cytoskeletal protein CcmA (bactofilin family)